MNTFDFIAKNIDGTETPLSTYRGQVLLIVNVASKCGFTPQYAELEAIYRQYRERGFSVLGFPCDQFGHQEPASEAQIKQFCSLNYGVSFPMFSKIAVNGDRAHDLYKYLKACRPGMLGLQFIRWNFTKFLVGRDGFPRWRFGPAHRPSRLQDRIESLLG